MIKITFLGTSSAVPSAERNHTAILLTYKGENILVDCGEGTQRQFRKAKISPMKVTRLLITHWHGDHALGVPGLLQTLTLNDYKKPLLIYGPKGIKKNIRNVLKAYPSVCKINIKIYEVSGKFLETDDFYLEAREMTHGRILCNAYCFVKKGQRRIDKKKLKKSKLPSGPLLQKLKKGKDIKYKGKKYFAKNLTYMQDSRKVCFVLDTTTNKKIASFAKNADLLITEASYMHELKELATRHKHMTAKQVAENAKKAKVRKLILTHLSERYAKDPKKILNEAKKTFKNTSLVKDLDVVKL